MPHRLPVDAGRLHRDMGTALASQPVRQREQLLGCRLEAAHLAPYRTVHHVPNPGHDRFPRFREGRLLCTSRPAQCGYRTSISPPAAAPPAWDPVKRTLESALPSPRRPVAQLGVLRNPGSNLQTGFSHQAKPDLCAEGASRDTINSAPVSSMAGRRSRWVTNYTIATQSLRLA